VNKRIEMIREDITPWAETGNADSISAYRVGWPTSRTNLMAERVLAAAYAQDPAAEVRTVVAQLLADFREEDAEFERAMKLAHDVRRMAGVR